MNTPDPAPVLSEVEGSRVSRPASNRRGAPKGNLNALKPVLSEVEGSGASSRQFQALAQELLSDPELVRSLGGTRQLSNQRLVAAIRTYVAEHQQAKERARQILEPYQSKRLVGRLAEILKEGGQG